MNAEPLRVLIVDDSRIFRAALQDALEGRAVFAWSVPCGAARRRSNSSAIRRRTWSPWM